MVRLCCGKGQTGADVFLLKVRKIREYFGLAYSGGQKIEDIFDPMRMPRMQGRPPHWFGLKVMRPMAEKLTLAPRWGKSSPTVPPRGLAQKSAERCDPACDPRHGAPRSTSSPMARSAAKAISNCFATALPGVDLGIDHAEHYLTNGD